MADTPANRQFAFFVDLLRILHEKGHETVLSRSDDTFVWYLSSDRNNRIASPNPPGV
jgi:hypothetical protein